MPEGTSHRKPAISRVAGAVVALSLLAAACNGAGGGATSGEGAPVRVGLVCGGMSPMLAQIAINADTFEGTGVAVEKRCFESGSDAVQAMIGGSIDVFMGSLEHVLATRAEGLDTRAYGVINDTMPYTLLARSDSSIESVTDLEGEKVAVTSPGSLSDTELQKAAADAGAAYEDMTVVSAGSGATMRAALEQESAAAGMVSDPELSEMTGSGDYGVVWEPNFKFVAIAAVSSTEWVEGNEDAMQGYLDGLQEAHEEVQADESFALEQMGKEGFQVSDGALEQAVEVNLETIPRDLTVDQGVYNQTVDLLVSVGGFGKGDAPPFEEALDFGLLKKGRGGG